MQATGGDARMPAGRRPIVAAAGRARGLAALFALAFAFVAAPAPAAQADEGAAPQGKPQSAETLRDPDFGVTTRHPGLQRHVEMYQWTRDGGGYALEWRGARVDSSGFAPGHENPRDIPLHEREWRVPVTLDGRPAPREVVDALGRWQQFRPNFSALPGNMSATFQPEGDGLGSAENPLAPQLGDLRITWRALALPPLADRLVLRDGQWALRTPAAAVVADAAANSEAMPRGEDRDWPRWPFVVAPIMIVLLVMAVVVRRRRLQ